MFKLCMSVVESTRSRLLLAGHGFRVSSRLECILYKRIQPFAGGPCVPSVVERPGAGARGVDRALLLFKLWAVKATPRPPEGGEDQGENSPRWHAP